MKKLLAATSVVLFASAASAAVYDTTGVSAGGNDGNQSYSGMLGNDFLVNVSGLQVTQLGAFNDDLNGISTDISVGLFDITANTAVISPISFNGAVGSSTYLFKDLATPVALIAGHVYSVQAFGYNSTDENYNTNVAGVNNGAIDQSTTPVTFDSMGGWLTNQNSRYGGATMGAGTAFGASSTFGAGTLTVTPVPEPETYAMMLAGLGAVGFMARRRRAH